MDLWQTLRAPNTPSELIKPSAIDYERIVKLLLGCHSNTKYITTFQNSMLGLKKLKNAIKRSEEISAELLYKLSEDIKTKLTENNTIGSHLSGGLDSSFLTSLTADILKKENKILYAFSSTPSKSNFFPEEENWSIDDRKIINEIIKSKKNIVSHLITEKDHALTLDKLASFCFRNNSLPARNPMNIGWISGILARAKEKKVKLILTGQFGNGTISWSGYKHNKARILRNNLQIMKKFFIEKKSGETWNKKFLITNNAINKFNIKKPKYLYGINLSQHQMINTIQSSWNDAIPLVDALENYYKVEMYDPSASKDIIEYCLSLPNKYYYSNEYSRALIRNAMKGIAPDSVRLRSSRGIQNANWFYELIECIPKYKLLLNEFKKIEAIRSNIDLKNMQLLLNEAETCDPWKHNPSELDKKFRFTLARSLHITEWIFYHYAPNEAESFP